MTETVLTESEYTKLNVFATDMLCLHRVTHPHLCIWFLMCEKECVCLYVCYNLTQDEIHLIDPAQGN